jgi:2-polyprenyl-3-methyl-5-hydroxy-6-metoxy-1,4-benzoquinol methylase
VIFTGSLEQHEGKFGKSSFDVVVLWGVIEHLQEPLRVLGIVKTLMRRDGRLVLYTPNADSLFHRLARFAYRASAKQVRFPMEMVITSMHQQYFTPATLRAMLALSGYTVLRMEKTDIDMDFVFDSHAGHWWSNRLFRAFSKGMQGLSRRLSMQSHLVAYAGA